MKLTNDQRTVLLGMGSAVGFSIAFVLALHHGGVFVPPAGASSPEARIAYALRCDFWAATALFAGIARIAAARFFTNEIDGSVAPRARALEIDRAYLTNTTEQLLLLVFAHVGLALVVAEHGLALIPILVTLFLVGRVTFWLGYRHSAPARAFGFGTTFYPTAACLVYAAFRLAGA